MSEMERAKILSEVALGHIPPDTVFTHGTLFNAATREFIRGQSIWIKDRKIAYVGPDQDPPREDKTLVIDAEDMVFLPGLIDGHTHAVSNYLGPEEFIKQVIPSGVTTIVTEASELAVVVGKDGIEYVVKGLERQPIRFFYTLPPFCGLSPLDEAHVPTNEELLPFLKSPNCLGIGEIYWGNLFLEGEQGERVRELVLTAIGLGKRVEGHTAGASGKKLQAYTAFGFSSCHEPTSEEEVLERLRLGYWVMIREGAVRKELEGVRGIFDKKIDFRRLVLVTDSVDPEGLAEEGYLDAPLKRAMALGVPPDLAYQMATLNVAEHFRIDHLVGSLSPGKLADLLVIPSPDNLSPQLVMCDGKIIYRDGKTLVEPNRIFFPDHLFRTVKVQGYTLSPLPKKGKVRVIELVTRLVTKERIIDLEDPDESKDVIMALTLDRLGSGKAFMGLLKGFGLERGAFGSTMCWDTADMIVVGCDPSSMNTAFERLKQIGGGGVYAIGEEVVAEFSAPLCGVLSLKPMETVRKEMKMLEDALRKNGVPWEKPVLTIDILTSPAIPHLKINHHGYVRLRERETLGLEV